MTLVAVLTGCVSPDGGEVLGNGDAASDASDAGSGRQDSAPDAMLGVDVPVPDGPIRPIPEPECTIETESQDCSGDTPACDFDALECVTCRRNGPDSQCPEPLWPECHPVEHECISSGNHCIYACERGLPEDTECNGNTIKGLTGREWKPCSYWLSKEYGAL